MPNIELVSAGGNGAYGHLAHRVGDGVIGIFERDDHSAHFGMDVTEDVTHSRLVEGDGSRGAALLEPQIESLAFKK